MCSAIKKGKHLGKRVEGRKKERNKERTKERKKEREERRKACRKTDHVTVRSGGLRMWSSMHAATEESRSKERFWLQEKFSRLWETRGFHGTGSKRYCPWDVTPSNLVCRSLCLLEFWCPSRQNCLLPCTYRQHIPPKRWYLDQYIWRRNPTTLHFAVSSASDTLKSEDEGMPHFWKVFGAGVWNYEDSWKRTQGNKQNSSNP